MVAIDQSELRIISIRLFLLTMSRRVPSMILLKRDCAVASVLTAWRNFRAFVIRHLAVASR
ncbi:MAG: hypothetical protein ACD_75C02533G0001 [uncultured bacterium]|nr:MAG: hypothetical protein ACD_75C02533G0001 [uncultured bacterium]